MKNLFFIRAQKLLLLIAIFASSSISGEPVNLIILGFGRRAQTLLIKSIQLKDELQKEISVIAVSDDYAAESLKSFTAYLELSQPEMADKLRNMLKNTAFYSGSDEDIEILFENHKNFDKVLITSPNYEHSKHLNAVLNLSSCKEIYMEKPLFHNLEDFETFGGVPSDVNIDVGLTLRYSNMARIVAEQLQAFKSALGPLQEVHSWDHLTLGRILSAFMMSWRRHSHLSGGLLLEKSIHDVDLALFFIDSLGICPEEIRISTRVSHNMLQQSFKEIILKEIHSNEPFRKSLECWSKKPWPRWINYQYDQNNCINWQMSLDQIFAGLPEDENSDCSGITPNAHTLKTLIRTKEGNWVNFSLDVKVDGFRTEDSRGTHLNFENGEVHIDIIESEMTIVLQDSIQKFDLCGDHTDHAGGNTYILHNILGAPVEEQYKATYDDPILQLSTLVGLLSEYQARQKIMEPITIKKVGNHWVKVD